MIQRQLYRCNGKNNCRQRDFIIDAEQLGITVTAVAIFFGIFLYAASVILHEEPYDESNPARIITKLEVNFGFGLPENMYFLKTGDTIAAGIDRPYVFVIRFETDPNGLTYLKKHTDFEEVTEQIIKQTWTDERIFTKKTPPWFKTPLEKGRTWESYLLNNKLHLHIVCVQHDSGDKVFVYMDGWGDNPLLRSKLNEKAD